MINSILIFWNEWNGISTFLYEIVLKKAIFLEPHTAHREWITVHAYARRQANPLVTQVNGYKMAVKQIIYFPTPVWKIYENIKFVPK